MVIGKTVTKVRLRARDALHRGKSALTSVEVQSPSDNVFHCCLHKTASQWIRRIAKDSRVFKYSGLRDHHYQSSMPGGHDPRPVNERSFDEPFPMRTFVTPLYIDYRNYRSIPKPESARGFFVTRDPRDIVVSWYFSSLYSHRLMGDLSDVRGTLSDVDMPTGLSYSIRHLADFGVFDAQRSWTESGSDPTVVVVRFEDLIGERSLEVFADLFNHCRIAIPSTELPALLETHSFERLSGRNQGEADPQAHFRKGVAGDWKNHFDESVREEFHRVTGDLVEALGYEHAI
ncbi:MAG TPA: sulfotransferase domain-containing protein [Acidimicrobiia bacterium]|nr:sulfotransferase domain-containing protein [Acidimicrobiia bacterium]